MKIESKNQNNGLMLMDKSVNKLPLVDRKYPNLPISSRDYELQTYTKKKDNANQLVTELNANIEKLLASATLEEEVKYGAKISSMMHMLIKEVSDVALARDLLDLSLVIFTKNKLCYNAMMNGCINALEDKNAKCKGWAAWLFVKIAEDKINIEPAIWALAKNLGSNGETSRYSIMALVKGAENRLDTTPITNELIKALENKNMEVRLYAAVTFTLAAKNKNDIGPAIGALAKTLGDTDRVVRMHVASALEKAAENKLDMAPAISALVGALGNEIDVRKHVIGALIIAARMNKQICEKIINEIQLLSDSTKYLEEAENNSNWFISASNSISKIFENIRNEELGVAA